MSSTNKVNRGRTLARSQALQLLFQAEARNESIDHLLVGDYLLSKGPLNSYAAELARGCYQNRARIDAYLRYLSRNWSLDRMPGTDRNLLRLAVYEMRFLPEAEKLDDAVVIDEAVEIAKAYGTDESAKFVNGILGCVARSPELPDVATVIESDGDASLGSEPAADGAQGVADPAADDLGEAFDGSAPDDRMAE